MRPVSSNASILKKATRGLAGCLGLSTSPRRKTTPPPILLRMEDRTSTATVNDVRKPKLSTAKNTLISPALPYPVLAEQSSLQTLQNASGLVSRAINWIQTRKLGRSSTRRLHVSETVSLGEKRFVAVIQIDGSQYLVGGGATNVALLAKLNAKESFHELLNETMTSSELQIDEPAAEQIREKA
jgi:hypothetical protein